ncbi:unnamed protein product [Prorocentrum cordatum]|uniref:Uncharacterized protein n=1 Tax=Prorocentrum cordatum TaxID=2364126 RepID=A0ABN9TCN9_9DINO|nr:unnamed protein product [Polarella glacialis]
MAEHKGFGGCVYSALRHVTTPYVLVLQHDRPCLRSFDAAGILAIMEASGGSVKYVGLPTKASLARSEPHNLMSRWHIDVDGDIIGPAAKAAAATVGYQLRVLPFWYDSTHIEEMHAEICAAARAGSWRQAHARYATWLATDGGGPVVGHLRGRRYHEEAQLALHGWSGLQRRWASKVGSVYGRLFPT